MIFVLIQKDAEPNEHYMKIVRAVSESEAREIANKETGFEGDIWSDDKKVDCKQIDGCKKQVVYAFYY